MKNLNTDVYIYIQISKIIIYGDSLINISNYILVSCDINSAPRLSPHHPQSPRGQCVEPPAQKGGMMGDAGPRSAYDIHCDWLMMTCHSIIVLFLVLFLAYHYIHYHNLMIDPYWIYVPYYYRNQR